MKIIVPEGTPMQDLETHTEWAVQCCGATFPSVDEAHARDVCDLFNTRTNHPHDAVVVSREVTTRGWIERPGGDAK